MTIKKHIEKYEDILKSLIDVSTKLERFIDTAHGTPARYEQNIRSAKNKIDSAIGSIDDVLLILESKVPQYLKE